MEALVRHSWPDNVRELQNLIERSVILSTSAVLSGSLPELPNPERDGSRWSMTSMPAPCWMGRFRIFFRRSKKRRA
jgi:DNA-binding NtrC family response regulator